MTSGRRRVVVTGAAAGIGRACVETFLEDGWQVVGLDRNPSTELEHLTSVACDLADTTSVAAACAEALAGGAVHALVNNAALQVNKALVDTTDDEWAAVMNTNVRGAFECTRALAPALASARGAIVNIASVHAVATSRNVAAYAASKGALVALTRAAALELADDGVRCNALLPGAVDTPMLRDGLTRRPHPEGAEGNLAELRDRTPLRTVASPHEIARSVLFLADGERSPYITGQTLIADGGATARLSTE